MANYASRLVKVLEAEEGYLEKKSNSNLDSKTGNAGSNNYTKYARDLDAIPGFYNGKKNGYPWCDVFYDWGMVESFGVEEAKKLLNHGTCGAGCSYSAQYYRKAGRFHSSPKVGDQIFFGTKGNESHTGCVYKVTSSRVYTIEGNTSSASGVIANGGAVCKKSYPLNYSRIVGYGRPPFDAETVSSTAAAKKDNKIDTVEEVQIWLNEEFSAGLKVDDDYGPLTKKALCKVLQIALGFTGIGIDGIYGPKTNSKVPVLKVGSEGLLVKALQALLVCNGYQTAYVDGKFGSGTKKGTMAYQKDHNLTKDGKAGKATFSSLLG